MQRVRYHRGRLSAAYAARLESLPGWAWSAAEARWEQNFTALAAYAAIHGHTDPPPTLLSDSGDAVAEWVRRMRKVARAGRLESARAARLEALPGWSTAPRRGEKRGWDPNFDELLAYVAEHGHASPPQSYRTPAGTALGVWVSNQRKEYRNGSMARNEPHRIARLESLPGWRWNTFDALWENGFSEPQRYATEHGTATPVKGFVAASGHKLGQWAQDQRRNYRRGQLAEHRAQRLETLPGWRW